MSRVKQLSPHNQGLAYAFLVNIMWGTGGVAIKLVDKALPSSLFVGLRYGIGALSLGVIILRGQTAVLKNLPWLKLIIFGIIATGLTDLLFVEAIRRCGAIIGVMLARLEIPLGVIFAHWLLKEKVTKRAYWAGLLSLLGVCLISYQPGVSITLENSFYLGVLLGISAAILWALAGIYGKVLLDRHKVDPLAISFVRVGVGAIFALILAFLVIDEPWSILQNLQLADWLLILYLGVLLSGIGYWLYYKSLKLIDAHVASVLLSVSIAVLLMLGLIIGEKPSALQWLGIASVALSIYLVRKPPATAD